MGAELFKMGISQNKEPKISFLALRLHNNLSAAVITAHCSEVSSFI